MNSGTEDFQKTIIIVSQPGIRHNVLSCLLRSLPQTRIINTSKALSDDAAAIDTVVIDANLHLLERLTLISRIKAANPSIRCIVLTTTTRNHDALRAVGADQIFQQDVSLAELETAVLTNNGIGKKTKYENSRFSLWGEHQS